MKKTFAFFCEKTIDTISKPFFPIIIFLILSIIKLLLPGLYMDSVNPDYLAARILNPDKIPAWVYPDNALFPDYKYPLLNSLYGGATPAYIGLLVWKIIGHSVFSIRILHLAYGLLIIYLCYKIVHWMTKKPIIASIITLIICLDPTFLFAWRTQYYLQLFPLITFIPALILLLHQILGIKENGKIKPKLLILSGFLIGFSAWGYFIFALYFGVLLFLLTYYAWRKKILWRVFTLFSLSFLTGYLLFIYAHLSIIINQGFKGYLGSLSAMNSAYGISNHLNVDFWGRIVHVWNLLTHLFGGDFIAVTMAGETPYQGIGGVIFTLWALFILAFLSYKIVKNDYYNSELIHKLYTFNKLVALIVFVHLIFGIAIGPSLNYQHFIMLVPMIYLSGGIAIYGLYLVIFKHLAKQLSKKVVKITLVTLSLCLVVTFLNYNSKIYKLLGETGGTGYYSDAINRLSDYVYELPPNAVIAFPQWGYWMGVAAATGGAREMWSENTIEQLINDINTKPPREDYFIVLDVTQSEATNEIAATTNLVLADTVVFHSRNGIPLISLVHFKRTE